MCEIWKTFIHVFIKVQVLKYLFINNDAKKRATFK